MKTPQVSDWQRFWSHDQTQVFTRISWSKRRILAILDPYLRESRSVLDAGCGSGFFAETFWRQGKDAVALDFSEKALAITRERTEGKVLCFQTDLTRDDIRSVTGRSFDLIFSDGLLEHFSRDDQDKILTNFRCALNSGGVVVTVVPNRFSPWEWIRPFLMPGIEEKPFRMRPLIRLHEDNGFRIEKLGGLNTLPFRWSPDRFVGRALGMLLYTVCRYP